MMMEFHAVSQLEVTAVFSVTCECRLYLFPTDLWVGPVLFDPAISCYFHIQPTYHCQPESGKLPNILLCMGTESLNKFGGA